MINDVTYTTLLYFTVIKILSMQLKNKMSYLFTPVKTFILKFLRVKINVIIKITVSLK